MRCPSCGDQAITFSEWARGTEWHRTNCRKCRAPLKASAGTWASLLAAVGILVAVLVWGGSIIDGLGKTEAKLLVALPLALVAGGLGWFVGGYEKA